MERKIDLEKNEFDKSNIKGLPGVIIDEERKMEWARESQSSIFDDWKHDNINQLREDFCELCEEEFNDFCRDEYNNARD